MRSILVAYATIEQHHADNIGDVGEELLCDVSN